MLCDINNRLIDNQSKSNYKPNFLFTEITENKKINISITKIMGNEVTSNSSEVTARELIGKKDAIENELKELERVLKGVNIP